MNSSLRARTPWGFKLTRSDYLPFAFTEQGVAMLSSVLNSEQAIEVNIAIMRTFVRLRQMLETNEDSIANSLR